MKHRRIFQARYYCPWQKIVSVLASILDWERSAPDRVVGDKLLPPERHLFLSADGYRRRSPDLAERARPDPGPGQIPPDRNRRMALGPTQYLDVYAAVTGGTTESANGGQMPSLLLATGEDAIAFDSVGWNSVGWNSVGWNSVGWNSVGWNTVGWNSVGWNSWAGTA